MEAEIATTIWQDVKFYASLAVLCAAAVYAAMWATKGIWKLILTKLKVTGAAETGALRLIAGLYGAGCGIAFGEGWHGIGAIPGGLTTGVIGAALSSLVFILIKRRIEAATPAKS